MGNTLPLTGEDTEGLQPKAKAIKAGVRIQTVNPGASVNKQTEGEQRLTCSPCRLEAVKSASQSVRAMFDKELQCPRQGSELWEVEVAMAGPAD